MEYTMEDFIDCLCLKNQLVHAPLDKMLEEYQNYDSYAEFLLAVLTLKDTDSSFLLYDDSFMDKILRVLEIHRFDAITLDTKNVINDIIRYVNFMKSIDSKMKELLKKEYQSYHEDMRKIGFMDDESFLYSIAYDAVVLSALYEHDLSFITEQDMFLASINYFIEELPELFEDGVISQLAYDKVIELSRSGGLFSNKIRTYSKQTKSCFQKLQKEE